MRNSTNLDVLRSLAVITVMIDHLIPTLVHHGIHVPHGVRELLEHVGHAGVLAFFVHTSLVLMYSLDRLAAEPGSLTTRFYVRRLFRIYPLALVCIAAVVLLHLPDATWHEPVEPTTPQIAANVLLVQNLWTGHSVLVPLWSLPYEVEMYLVLPLLYLVARRIDGVRRIGLLLALSYVGAYVFRKIEHGHMNLAAYVPCFLCGVLVYALRDRVRPRLPGAAWGPFFLGLILVYCWIHTISGPDIYWMGWAFCLVLALALTQFRDLDNRVVGAASSRIATYSYGLYLLHVPALYVVFSLWQPHSVALGIAAYVALAAFASVIAYHVVEAPMVHLGRRLSGGARPA